MSELTSRSIPDVIRVVQVVEGAKKRIPTDITVKTTYYGRADLWLFHSVFDERRCDDCTEFEVMGLFGGEELRTTFPYHVILDVDLIMVHVHPHCRCFLTRVTPKLYPQMPGGPVV